MAIMKAILDKFKLDGELSWAGGGSWKECHGGELVSVSPIDGQSIRTVRYASGKDYDGIVQQAVRAFEYWHRVRRPPKEAKSSARSEMRCVNTKWNWVP